MQPLPSAYATHPLVAGHLIYALPASLLRHLQALPLRLDRCDPDLFRLEQVLTDSAEANHSVGLWNGNAIAFRFLAPPQTPSSDKSYIERNFSNDPAWRSFFNNGLDRGLAVLDQAADWPRQVALGYAGWLLTNPIFIEEHDRFFSTWRHMVIEHGLPRRGVVSAGSEPWLTDVVRISSDAERYGKEFRALLDRWELANMQSPYLPEPRQPQTPVLLPHQASDLVRGGGTLIYKPGNYPVPDRDAARVTLAGSSNATAIDDHLSQWQQIVSAKNNAKNRIPRYARVFQLQHYWMILQKRWGKRLDGQIEKLQLSFAAWLIPDNNSPDKGLDTIRHDLRLISASRGGSRWYRADNAIDLF